MPQILLPYGRLEPYSPDDVIPFGAALLITDPVRAAKVVDLATLAETNSWLLIAAVTASKGEGAAVLSLWRREPALSDLVLIPEGSTQHANVLRRVIAKRGAPTADEVVRYIHSRCDCETLARSLRAELLKLPKPARSARHEAFRGRGRLTAIGWQRLFLLARGAVLDGRFSAEGVSHQLLVDGRTIRAATKAIDISWDRINEGFGWKWVVEVVLRRYGYVRGNRERLLQMA